ncbi:hypothetical protein MtrunA17_Chr1g0165401 [Medicago truncatula]|uniref:Uncharacterized protein n=1 Tax=Medicago truncatula TaxID=3880 RepID=A0A396JJL8_MEDTR|nr:hypothetical protein MtrunA17_Chr1g0165401 [Medicago truncatula]
MCLSSTSISPILPIPVLFVSWFKPFQTATNRPPFGIPNGPATL